MPQLCKEIGTSPRTLAVACRGCLGISPKQYWLRRRLILVHDILDRASPGETTVTETFTRYGLWNFGRSAGTYRRLFGETPSQTLARM